MKSCPPWAGSRSDGSPPPAPPAVAVLAALLRLPAGGPGCAWRRSPPREQPSWADLGRAALPQPFPFTPTSRRPPVNLNAHAGARCSLRSKKAFFRLAHVCLNAPTGAWCSLEGYSAGSWRRSPWTTCVPLDHGGPIVVLEGGVRVSASGARRRRAPRSARSSGNPRECRVTAEIVT